MVTKNNSIKYFLTVSSALMLIGISINMFLAPHSIAAGGISGIGVLVEYTFGISRAHTVFLLNIIMVTLAYFFLGHKVFANMLLGSILLPISLAIVPETIIISNRFISIIFGSALFGVGVAILYRNNSSSGGTTIPPLIMKKHFNIDTSIGLLATDFIIVIFNIFVFGITSFILAVLSLIITSITMHIMEKGLPHKRHELVSS
jgi:Uncharacterized conserved protein